MARRRRKGDEDERPSLLARVAAVVTLLGAIVGLVTGVIALWPEEDPPPAGKITRLDRAGTAAFSETDFPDTRKCPGIEKQPRYRVGLPLATAGLALAQSGDPGTEEPPPPETTDPEPPPEDTDPTPAPPEGPDPTPRPRIDPEELAGLARDAGLEPDEVSSKLESTPPGEDPPTTGETEEMLANTLPARTGTPLDRLGWLVDIDTLLEHLDGKCAYVHWTLYNERTNRRLPNRWHVDRRGVRFIARGTPDRRSAELWIPIPRAKGRYMLRAALYDAEATRLDVARSKGLK